MKSTAKDQPRSATQWISSDLRCKGMARPSPAQRRKGAEKKYLAADWQSEVMRIHARELNCNVQQRNRMV